jgi:primosomal protein N' (replication factor Y) (superfamily II helicase)
MSVKSIFQIVISAPLRQHFDYLPPSTGDLNSFTPGIRVRVPFGRQEQIGILLNISNNSAIPSNRLKQVTEAIDSSSIFNKDIFDLCLWAADYYHHPLGEVFSAALPALLREGKAASLTKEPTLVVGGTGQAYALNADQQLAVTRIQEAKGRFQVLLLEGITGSGKTEVYLQAMQNFLQAQQQVLVLVPEIGLTPQTIQRFRERFNEPVVAFHSGLTEKERLNTWLLVKSGKAKIVIGTRSAVFTPFANLGLIVVDEEHDHSFKQQEGFRYHARDLAIVRARLNCIPIVLGSATPSLESLYNAEQKRFQHLSLLSRAGNARLPDFEVLDVRKKTLDEGLSPSLLTAMHEHLNRGEQVMLFLNRRGFAPVLMCHACGWMAECKRCDTRMTYHKRQQRLHCHRCDAQKEVVTVCDKCREKELLPVGHGTERLEISLAKHFPLVSIARIDRDNTQRKGSMEKLLSGIQSGEHQILVGTQMLAKGHHFPNVTLVAIVGMDAGFFSSDFRALEHMGQLILQVSGRAGRMEKLGKVKIQTHYPDHPLLQTLLQEGYASFAKKILLERREAALPPYAFFAMFRAEAHQLSKAMQFLQEVRKKVVFEHSTIQIAGPFPSSISRRAGYYRAQLIIQAKQRSALQHFLKKLLIEMDNLPMKHKVRWSLDVDPVEMA